MADIAEEKPLSEMSNEEILSFIEALRERRKNVSLKKVEEREERDKVKNDKVVKKKDTFAGDSSMNNLLDDILKDI